MDSTSQSLKPCTAQADIYSLRRTPEIGAFDDSTADNGRESNRSPNRGASTDDVGQHPLLYSARPNSTPQEQGGHPMLPILVTTPLFNSRPWSDNTVEMSNGRETVAPLQMCLLRQQPFDLNARTSESVPHSLTYINSVNTSPVILDQKSDTAQIHELSSERAQTLSDNITTPRKPTVANLERTPSTTSGSGARNGEPGKSVDGGSGGRGRRGRKLGREKTGGTCESIRLSVAYTAADVARRKRNAAIGISAVFLLVFFTGLIICGIDKIPYLLLRLSELSSSEADMMVQGSFDNGLINFTALKPILMRQADIHGASARWMARATMAADKRTLDDLVEQSEGNVSSRLMQPNTTVNILLIDSLQEKRMGLGRAWPYRAIGFGEAQIYHSIASFLDTAPNAGQRVRLEVPLQQILNSPMFNKLDLSLHRPTTPTTILDFMIIQFFLVNGITAQSISLLDIATPQLSVTVADTVDASYGKYSSVVGNVVIMDYNYIAQYIMHESGFFGSDLLVPRSPYQLPSPAMMLPNAANAVRRFRIEDYAMSVAATFNDRYKTYYASFNHRNRLVTYKSNRIMLTMGVDFAGDVSYPIATNLDTFESFRALMTAMFIAVVIAIAILCAVLVFTLLRINAEERQFELAMLRAQGMPRSRITYILLTQTFAFAIPGTALGILVVWAANAIMERTLANFTHAPARALALPIPAAVASAGLGIALPLAATYGPVRRALGGSLRDALDVYRQAEKEVHVMKIRMEELGLKTWQLVLGAFLTLAGFGVYYCIPLSFIFQNMLLFFVLLDVMLLCMVFGLCIILRVVERHAERAVLFLLLWGKERRLGTLIRKNLRNHDSRNSLAFLTFLLTVAVVTAAGVMFTQLAEVTAQVAELSAGAPVSIVSSSIKVPLDEARLDDYLRNAGAQYVSSWAYSSFPLSDYPQITSDTKLDNFVSSSSSINVVALTENFMDATYPDMTKTASTNSNYDYPSSRYGRKDVVRSLYIDPPVNTTLPPDFGRIIVTGLDPNAQLPNLRKKLYHRIPAVIATAVKDVIGVDATGSAKLTYSYAIKDGSMTVQTDFSIELRALMRRVAGFPSISDRPSDFKSSQLLLSRSYFEQLLNATQIDYDDQHRPPLPPTAVTMTLQRVLYVQLRDGLSKSDRESLVNALQPLTNDTYHVTVDTEEVKEQLSTVKHLVMGLFYFSAVICIVVCGFMMWVTFIANVQLHAWTFGVLRALGFQRWQLIRSAVYEALSIVISSFVLGLAVGVVVGLTLASQLMQLMSVPFGFAIPYVLILVVLGLALAAAVLGSILPFIPLSRKTISSVLRGI